jgi:hypothetical protein
MMGEQVLAEFKTYAAFSVRVDRYFHFVSIFGLHHEGLRVVYDALPSHERLKEELAAPNMAEDLKRFLATAAGRLRYLATTNVFNEATGEAEGEMWSDVLNFAFYTCYCFQWSLFEDFLKTIVKKAIDAGAFDADIAKKLRSRWRKTKEFLDLIESGAVFGKSPFRSALPVLGWQPSIEEINYSHLDRIRDLRNKFIHGVESPEIISEGVPGKQRLYERSMWILRRFAENVQWEAQEIMIKKLEPAGAEVTALNPPIERTGPAASRPARRSSA